MAAVLCESGVRGTGWTGRDGEGRGATIGSSSSKFYRTDRSGSFPSTQSAASISSADIIINFFKRPDAV